MKLPPHYTLTGKKDVWYLELIIEDQWDTFDTAEEAIDAAWEDHQALFKTSYGVNANTLLAIAEAALRTVISLERRYENISEQTLEWMRELGIEEKEL